MAHECVVVVVFLCLSHCYKPMTKKKKFITKAEDDKHFYGERNQWRNQKFTLVVGWAHRKAFVNLSGLKHCFRESKLYKNLKI